MADILNFSDRLIKGAEQKALDDAIRIGSILSQKSQRIQDLEQNFRRRTIVAVTPEDLTQWHIQRIWDIVCPMRTATAGLLLAIQYIAQFLSDLASNMDAARKEIVAHPWTVDFASKGDWQHAGDTAVYGFLFTENDRRNVLTRDDYQKMMSGYYYQWYIHAHRANNGYILSHEVPELMRVITPEILEHWQTLRPRLQIVAN